MKILKIRIKNIHSLRCQNNEPFVIDLQAAPLAGAGIFLITGKTGAGKSTILDAITLALFDRIARSRGKIEEKVLSQGETEAMAEVEFETDNGMQYRAKWQVNSEFTKARKGSPSKHTYNKKREIGEVVSQKLLTDKSNQVDAEIIRLLEGLNYEQFIRSVMLAQGEFAKFLKDGKEKSEILERITDTVIYSEISNSAFKRHKLEKELSEQLNKEKEQKANSLLSVDGQKLLSENVGRLVAENKIQSELQKQLVEELQQTENYYKLLSDKKNIAENIAQWESSSQKLIPQSQKLFIHKEVLPYKDLFKLLNDQSKAIEEQKLQIQSVATQRTQNQRLILQLSGAQKLQKVSTNQKQDDYNTSLPIWASAKELDIQIKTLTTQLATNRQKEKMAIVQEKEQQLKTIMEGKNAALQLQNTVATEWQKYSGFSELFETELYNKLILNLEKVQTLYRENKQADKNLSDLQLKLSQNDNAQATASQQYNQNSEQRQLLWKEYNLYVEQNGLSFDNYGYNDLQNVNKQLEECRQLITNVQLAGSTLKDLYQKMQQLDSLKQEIENYELQETELYKELLTTDEELNNANQYLMKWERDLKKTQYILELQSHLSADSDCPVCGSKDKPFMDVAQEIKNELTLKLTTLKNEENSLKANKELLLKQYNSSNSAIINHKNTQLTAAEKEKELLENIYKLELSINQLLQNQNAAVDIKDFNEKRLKELERYYQQKEVKYLAVIARQKSWQKEQKLYIDNIESLEKQLNRLKETASEHKKEQNELSELLLNNKDKEKDLLKTITELGSNYEWLTVNNKELRQIEQQLIDKQKEYFKFKKQFADNDKQANESEQKLNLIAQEVENAKNNYAEIVAYNQKITETINRYLAERQKLNTDDDPEAARQGMETEIGKLQSAEKQTETAIQTQQTAKAVLDSKEEQLLQNKAKQEHYLEELVFLVDNLRTEKGFSDLDEFKNGLLDANVAEKITEELNQNKLQLEKWEEKKNENELLITAVSANIKALDRVALNTQIAILQKQQDANNRELGKITEQLNRHELQSVAHSELISKVEAQKAIENEWNTLNELIGNENGGKFRNYAQSLTLQHLLYYANQHLSKFVDGRYQLIMKDMKSLELSIIDNYQAENERSLDTLSGGESFLASLALALALSDLASGKMKIESLFIDEGFGTLDNETLSTAISALQSLQSQGKTIGIISHVEQLQLQISTQVKVIIKGAGVSDIEIVG